MVRLWQLLSSPEKSKHFDIMTYSLAIRPDIISLFCVKPITVLFNRLINQPSYTNGCFKDRSG